MAICYIDDYEKANNFYIKIEVYDDLLKNPFFWFFRGIFYNEHKKYESSLDCFHEALVLIRNLSNIEKEVSILDAIAHTYKDWDKLKKAIDYYQQSKDIYLELGRD